MSTPRPEPLASELLERQLAELNELRNTTARDPRFREWRQTTLTVVQRIWPTDPTRAERFRRVPFSAPSSRMSQAMTRNFYEKGCAEAVKLLRAYVDDAVHIALDVTDTVVEADEFAPGSAEDDFPVVELPGGPTPSAPKTPATAKPPVAEKPATKPRAETPPALAGATPAASGEEATPESHHEVDAAIDAMGARPRPVPRNMRREERREERRDDRRKSERESNGKGDRRRGDRRAGSRQPLKDMLGFGDAPSAPPVETPGRGKRPATPPPPRVTPRPNESDAAAPKPVVPPRVVPPRPEPSPAPSAGPPRTPEPVQALGADDTEVLAFDVELDDVLTPEVEAPAPTPAGETPAPNFLGATPVKTSAPVTRPPVAPPALEPPSEPVAPPAAAAPPVLEPVTEADDDTDPASAMDAFMSNSPVLSASGRPLARANKPSEPAAPTPPATKPAATPAPVAQTPSAAPAPPRAPVNPPVPVSLAAAGGSSAGAAMAALAAEVGNLGVPEGHRAAARAELLDLARRLDAPGGLDWSSVRGVIGFVMEYPPLARRVIPMLIPYLDRAA